MLIKTFPVAVLGVVCTILLILLFVIDREFMRKYRALEQQRFAMHRGTAGEDAVVRILENLPRDFHVVNDLSTAFGNLDHIVVGPTGVFIIDAKNRRGVVAANAPEAGRDSMCCASVR